MGDHSREAAATGHENALKGHGRTALLFGPSASFRGPRETSPLSGEGAGSTVRRVESGKAKGKGPSPGSVAPVIPLTTQ
jgi:hypothetical protein